MKKIDIHIHTEEHSIQIGEKRIPSVDELANSIYEDLNVDKAILMTTIDNNCSDPATLEKLCDEANKRSCELATKYKDLLYWFCYVDPRIGSNSAETDFSPYLEKYKKMGAKGLGEIFANIYFDDPRVENLLSYCEKYDMPILFHLSPEVGGPYGIVDDLGLPRLEKMLKKFPNLKFIGHSQVFWSEISTDVTEENRNGYPTGPVNPGRVVELLRKYPNLYADLSAGSGYTAISRDVSFGYSFLEEFQDRLMYGTDYLIPRGDIRLTEFLDSAVDQGKISREAYEKIVRKNAIKILNLN
ncbi:MAG: amidohydrolase [Clostridiales bacterium]|nr:amidohydrolase [Clostridiales bacterium]